MKFVMTLVGQTAAMKGVMHLVNDEEIKAIADHLSKLK